jgi:hypothetical protein
VLGARDKMDSIGARGPGSVLTAECLVGVLKETVPMRLRRAKIGDRSSVSKRVYWERVLGIPEMIAFFG